jgi:hypothetical protein
MENRRDEEDLLKHYLLLHDVGSDYVEKRAAFRSVHLQKAAAFVPAHNWDRYDWGTAPPVRDRLNQGPASASASA